ncbi:MAG: DUF3267 domain-containing protein [Erysipelotrichaceae bacterium]|nr:DUF3267 domain-containing protein [Erysipelotrichaceae bacterium]
MKLTYKGKFNGDPNSLPQDELEKHPDAVEFKEIKEYKKFVLFMNVLSLGILAVFAALYLLIATKRSDFEIGRAYGGFMCSILTLLPHEFLHAICFKGEVFLYWMSSGAFVTCTDPISKSRFIFMSMLPNLVFGFIPFILFLINPAWCGLGAFGTACISMGAGDYYNVYNCATQVPANGMCFMHKMQTFWFTDGE